MFAFCCTIHEHIGSAVYEQVTEMAGKDTSVELACSHADVCFVMEAKGDDRSTGNAKVSQQPSSDDDPGVRVTSEAKNGCREEAPLRRGQHWRRTGGPLFLETQERCLESGYTSAFSTGTSTSCPSSRTASDCGLNEDEFERRREVELCHEFGVLLLPECDEDSEGEDEARGRQLRTFLNTTGFKDARTWRRRGGIFSKRFLYPLHAAVEESDAEAVKLLLWGKADVQSVDSEEMTPLALAHKLDDNNSHAFVIRALSMST